MLFLGCALFPGWCGEVRDVIYNDNGKVTVVYRVTIRGIDGEVPNYYLLFVMTVNISQRLTSYELV